MADIATFFVAIFVACSPGDVIDVEPYFTAQCAMKATPANTLRECHSLLKQNAWQTTWLLAEPAVTFYLDCQPVEVSMRDGEST